MKTTRLFPTLRECGQCVLLMSLFSVPAVWGEPAEVGRRNDEQMWGLMRQMLAELGYEKKVAMLDTAWQKMNTPAQWAALKQEQLAWTNCAVRAARELELRAAISPEVQAIAKLCQATAPEGFARVLEAVCQASHNVVQITGGLLLWTNEGGAPLLQGQDDKALHFIYGAYLEATFGMGTQAGVMKEQSDLIHGRVFDCNDMAATFAGAEWVRRANTDEKWIGQWASGQKTLAANLPALHYTILKDGFAREEYEVQVLQDIFTAFNRLPKKSQPSEPNITQTTTAPLLVAISGQWSVR